LSAITLQNIGHLPLVSMPPSSGIRQLIDAEALKIGLILNHEITTNQYNTMFNFILAGLGVSIVPVSVVRELDKSQFCVKTIEPVINRKLAVLIRSNQILGDASKQFLKLLLPNLKNIS
jgi:LysR family carnitine catabolism transcriptional activator